MLAWGVLHPSGAAGISNAANAIGAKICDSDTGVTAVLEIPRRCYELSLRLVVVRCYSSSTMTTVRLAVNPERNPSAIESAKLPSSDPSTKQAYLTSWTLEESK